MAGEITGGKGSNVTCIPKKAGTVTEETWRTRVKDGGYLVQFDAATTTADEVGVASMSNNGAVVYGRAIGYTGSGDDFRITVETEGAYGYIQGSATGAFAATDYGKRMKSNANGKWAVDTSLTAGNVFLVGGDKANPAVAWRGQTE